MKFFMPSAEKPVNTAARFSTGVRRLDTLLPGGFYRGAMYVIQGQPGMGKTVLANQICFERIRAGENAVFFSLLAESTSRMMTYLTPFEFVDKDAVGEKLEYVAGYQPLKEKGTKGLLEVVRGCVMKRRARVLVLDGLDTVETFTKSEIEFREFLYSLQALAALSECTVLLLTPLLSSDPDRPRPEQALSDGVLRLSEYQSGPRAIREIQILKFRGSAFLKGRHEFEISSAGFDIHPRTEVQFGRNRPVAPDRDRSRMMFGIKEFDSMTHGGVMSGSMTAIVGAPGTGKTSLGISFLAEGARRGEPGVYFGFYETPDDLLAKADSIGIDLRLGIKKGLVEIQWQQAVEGSVDGLAERLMERIRDRKKERIRVFVDGMSGFRKALVYPERFGVLLSAMTNELRNIGATTIYSEETDMFASDVAIPNRELGSIVDNVFFLRYVELRSQLYRLISIMKMRESGYDSAIRQFLITPKGMRVSDSFESAESILTGLTRTVNGKSRASARKAKR
jgi:circadian clock protein KaiC